MKKKDVIEIKAKVHYSLNPDLFDALAEVNPRLRHRRFLDLVILGRLVEKGLIKISLINENVNLQNESMIKDGRVTSDDNQDYQEF